MLLCDPESAVTFVHRLLHAPVADLAVVAETSLRTCWCTAVPRSSRTSQMCAEEAVWREAVGMVLLADAERAAVPALASYLPAS